MSELSKNQLTQENNNSFPNNNTGYITPTLLRTFNQNMIDSLVDEQQYNVVSASFNQRINVLDPSGSAQAITSLQIATASLNAYTQSQNSFNSSATASIVALQTWSSSLDTTYATDAQLSASASTLQNNINTKLDSASFNSYTASQSSNISSSLGSYLLTSSFNSYTQSAASGVSASINAATQSLSSSIATTTSNLSSSIGSLSASVAATDAGQLSTQSFNLFTQSVNTNISQINARVSSSATTGKDKDFSKVAMYLKRLKAFGLKNPFLVGFGIKDKESFNAVNEYANGAIIGSAYIKALSAGDHIHTITKNFLSSILK
jgi:hypothetical protein